MRRSAPVFEDREGGTPGSSDAIQLGATEQDARGRQNRFIPTLKIASEVGRIHTVLQGG